jgi:hypothetical protein
MDTEGRAIGGERSELPPDAFRSVGYEVPTVL